MGTFREPRVQAAKDHAQSKAAARPLRASTRPEAVHIDAACPELKWLMTEQRRTDRGYLTVYKGTRQKLIEAGVPENAFPGPRKKWVEFDVQLTNVCCTGKIEKVTGSTFQVEHGFELEIHWGAIRPYIQAAHPALNELARMMLKDVMRWTDDYQTNSLEQPFARLASDPRATDFTPDHGGRKFKVTPEFHNVLRNAADRIYELVHTAGEILLLEEAADPVRLNDNVIAFRRPKLCSQQCDS